jgi:hypothetical protein
LVKERIYDFQERNEFSMAGFPSLYPVFLEALSKNNKDKIEKLIFQEVFKIAVDENISYMNFYVSPLSDAILNKNITVNPLPKFGLHDTTISTNILKLDNDESILFGNFSQNVRRNIKIAAKNGYKVKIFDKKNITKDIFNIYKDLHFQASERKTRPDRTWDIMFEWILNDMSMLSLTMIDDGFISAQLINTYDKKAYYQSGATKPGFERKKGIGHLAQWEIIKYLKLNDFKFYELGVNWHPNISQEVADAKMLGISRFKAGFGADVYPFFRGEWFRDKDFMHQVYSDRFSKYLSLFKKIEKGLYLHI